MKVKFGPSCVSSLERAEFALAEGIGNSFGLLLSDNSETACALAEFCQCHKVPFVVMGLARRGKYREDCSQEELFSGKPSAGEFQKIMKAGGEYYLGRYVVGESSGMLYWPSDYLVDPTRPEKHQDGEYPLLPPADNLAEARGYFVKEQKKYLEKEHRYGGEPFWCTESSMVFRECLENGVDVPFLEMFPGNPERMLAALRGAARAGHRKDFGALIAFGWYGGAAWDELYFRRWRNSLYYSYMAGVTVIHSESGQFGCTGLGNHIACDSAEARRFREIMKEFTEFCNQDERPDGGPQVKTAAVYGNLDGYPGLWANSVWGQFHRTDFQCGDAERSWDILSALVQKRPWYDNLNIGKSDLSGQFADGMYDIIPAQMSLEDMKKYSCLFFLGWNTMTPELYQRLVEYVKNGGHLLMALPHLCTNLRRNTPWKLINGGNLQELFGVRIEGEDSELIEGIKFRNEKDGLYDFPDWGTDTDPKFMGKGFAAGRLEECSASVRAFASKVFSPGANQERGVPVLLEHRCGNGRAFLLNAWAFPGSENLFEFCRVVLQSVMAGERSLDYQVICSEAVRYARYGEVLYCLNTDSDLPSSLIIRGSGRDVTMTLQPGEFRKVFLPELPAAGEAFQEK